MLVILIVSLILTINYLYFLYGIYSGLGKFKNRTKSKEVLKVTVIIPYRNEKDNILKCLKSVELQDYPKNLYEVIFVNDLSDDISPQILEKAYKSENIKLLSVPESYHNRAFKKRAIKYGLEKCTGDIIITTDADCEHPTEWISTMISCFDKETAFVSGPVVFTEEETLFNDVQRLEFASLVIVGAGLIGSGKPTICNAANLAYRKSVFDEVKGYEDNMNLSSGDDELLMQKIAKNTNYKIKFCADKNALIQTKPNSNIKEFYNQRKRWASKGLFYFDKSLIFRLILIFLFYMNFIVLGVIGLFYNTDIIMLLVLIFSIKIMAEYLVVRKGVLLLFDKSLLNSFFMASLMHIPYIVISGISGAVGNYNWKGRKLKR